jgi:hypothetical protein
MYSLRLLIRLTDPTRHHRLSLMDRLFENQDVILLGERWRTDFTMMSPYTPLSAYYDQDSAYTRFLESTY